ncbi:hypothetical protein FPV67DRAFT_1456501 [Lyophyllum atratum]|nr:hypothetical protein FPV67DRAFT_1456501 [Lyophyllum atratum]
MQTYLRKEVFQPDRQGQQSGRKGGRRTRMWSKSKGPEKNGALGTILQTGCSIIPTKSRTPSLLRSSSTCPSHGAANLRNDMVYPTADDAKGGSARLSIDHSVVADLKNIEDPSSRTTP